MKKRLLSILLAALMLVGMLPVTAWATDTTTATKLVIPVSAKLSKDSLTPTGPISCTFTLEAVKKIIDGVESTTDIPMPSPATLTLSLTDDSKTTPVEGKFEITLPSGTDVGTYYYKVKQNTTTVSGHTIDTAVWTVEANVTAGNAEVTKVANEITAAKIADNFDETTAPGTGEGAATVTVNNNVTTLKLGGNTVVEGEAFNRAVIKSNFAVDFTRDFTISGEIKAASAPDGSFIGFVPGGELPNELDEYAAGGTLAVYGTPAFENSILLEFDSYCNGIDDIEYLDFIDDENCDFADPHFALMEIKKIYDCFCGCVVPGQDVIQFKGEQVNNAWNKSLSYTITLDTEDDADPTNDVLKFSVDNDEYNWSYTNPTGRFGEKSAYFFMGGVLRYGKNDDEEFEIGSVDDPAPVTEISFEEFEYTKKILFVNTYCPHTHNGITFDPWDKTDSLPTSGNYYLTNDVTLSETWNVPAGTTNLCLNGHVIKLGEDKTGSVITVPANATLNLYDCNGTNQTHYFTVGDNGLWTLNDSHKTNATSLESLTTRPAKGDVIAVTGGVITGGTGTGDGSVPTNYNGGGVLINGGTLTLNGGNIVGNSVTNQGGGVNVNHGGTFTMLNGGNIVGNYADGAGGGVYVIDGTKGTFTLKNGCVSYNTAVGNGGGVCAAGDFIMEDGIISCNSTNASGGGVRVTGAGTFKMTAGTISNNTAATSGGGVDVVGTVTLGGTAQITDNTAGSDKKTASNLYLPNNKTVTLGTSTNGEDGNKVLKPASGMSVGVTTQTAPTKDASVPIAVECQSDCSACFFPDAGRMTQDVEYNENENIVYLTKPTIAVTPNGTNPVYGTANTSDKFSYQGEISGFGTEPTLKVEWKHVDGETVTWNEAAPATGLSVTASGIVTTEATTPAGDYIFRVTNSKAEKIDVPDDDGDKTIDNPEFVSSGEITLTVEKADASATPPTANSLTYNGQAQALVTAGTPTGGTMRYVLGTDATTAPEDGWRTTVPKETNAGTYYVWYKVVGDDNHNDTTPTSVEVTIVPKNVEGATVGNFGALTYTGGAQTPSATVTIDGLTATGTWSNVTSVADTTTFTASGNFTGTITGKATGMLKSTPGAPTGLAGVKPTTYGGGDGKITGTTAAMEYSSTTDFTAATDCSATETTGLSAGTYYVRVKATDNTNPSGYATVTVPDGDKADFDIAITNYEAAYDGQPHGITLTGVPNGATVKYGTVSGTYNQDSLTYTDFTDGAKTVYVKVTKDGFNDYTGSGTVNITKATLTVTGMSAADKIYDGNTNATITGGALSGVLGGDNVSIANLATSGTFADKNVGSGKAVSFTEMTLTGGAADNYTLTQPTLTANITKKQITITANDKSAYVGETAPTLGVDDYTVTGLVGGDTLTTKPTLAYESEPDMSKAGTVAIKASDASAGNNYTITYEDGTLTISNRPSSGGGSTPTVTVPVSGDKDSVKISVTVSGSNATIKNVTSEQIDKVGTGENVTIDLSGLGKSVSGVTIPKTTLENVAASDADGLEVKLPNGTTAVFDSTTVAAVAEQAAGSNIQLVIDKEIKAEQALNAAQKETVKALNDALVLDAYFVSNGKRISDFKGGEAELTVSYPTTKPVRVWYVASDGTKELVPSTFDGKAATFVVTHFSHYAIEILDGSSYAACPKDATCPIEKFTDTKNDFWWHDGIHYCLDNGLMNGIADTQFAPNGTITRGMIVTMLWRLDGQKYLNYYMTFKDVPASEWYTEAVRWAAAEKIVSGYDAEHFGPNDPVTREQLATILYNYAKYKGQGFTGNWMFLLDFVDRASISSWADEAVHWCSMKGIVTGKDGKVFDPQGNATRAEAATMMQRFCEAIK